MSADTKIDPNGGVAATDQLAQSALKSQRDHREDQVNWKHAPDWAAVYAVQNRFGNTSAKWWGAIGDHAADGPQDQDKSADAPVYFQLNDGEPIKMFHRPVAKTAAEAEIQQAALENRTSERIRAREGENPMVGKVTGYRTLTQAELTLVNTIKAQGELFEALYDGAMVAGADPRMANLARTKFQEGAMWLIRAVAKPQGFF